MPQIFHRSFNTLSRVSIFGAVFILAGAAWAYGRYIRSDYYTGVGNALDQPVPFSHKHHVEGLGIDCRYCHTSVEDSPYAGLPPTRTCMNCHSQVWLNSPLLKPVRDSYKENKPIEWERVHNLKDFVYFDHSVHVKKGIGCNSCHGPVHEMNLMYQASTLHMEWCLNCHRHPEQFVRPREEVFNTKWQPGDLEKKYPDLTPEKLIKEYEIQKRTDCSVCHR